MTQVAHLNIVEKLKCDSAPNGFITCMSFTATGNALIAFDSQGSQLIFKLSPITDLGKVQSKL